ncbi:hypothetical protein O3M35_004904 [Rhynocoris fuscipes]|uniref:Nitrophorin domain-containing protein n=1 Tax=Rhynocoris fuscipes TaxID=488301 RepID=A0AAW1DGT2_9HEMI
MFTFTALLLVGLFALSSATSYEPECTNYPAKQDLNSKAFFKGTWYITHALNPDSTSDVHDLTVCHIIKPQYYSPILYQFYKMTVPREQQSSYVQGYAILNDGDSKFVTQFRPVTKDGEPLTKFVPFIETIIDTDYENYAVGYFCVEHPDGLVGGNIVVLGRSPNPDKIHADIDVVLNRIGLKLSDLISTKKLNCPED